MPTGPISQLRELQKKQDEPSFLKETGKGVASGLVNLASSVGTGIEYLGGKLDDQDLLDLGETVASYWNDVNQEHFQAHESLRGPIYTPEKGLNTDLLSKAAWWGYNVGNIVPSVAASMIPGAAVAKGAKALQIGQKVVRWTPSVVAKMGRLGRALADADKINRGLGAAAGGLVGGALEGSSTYQEVLQRGGSRDEAEAAAEQMTLASGFLNALSVGQMMKKLPKGVIGNLERRTIDGLVEGITEWLEEPSEAYIKMRLADKKGSELKFTPEQAMQQIYNGLNVIPPSIISGMLFGGGEPASVGQVTETRAVPEPTGPLTTAAQGLNRAIPLNEEGAMRRAEALSAQGMQHAVVPHPEVPNKFTVMPVQEVQNASEVRGNEGQVQEGMPAVGEGGEVLRPIRQDQGSENIQLPEETRAGAGNEKFGLTPAEEGDIKIREMDTIKRNAINERAGKLVTDEVGADRKLKEMDSIKASALKERLDKMPSEEKAASLQAFATYLRAPKNGGEHINSKRVDMEISEARRRHLALRESIDNMTPEDRATAISALREMALTSRLTGLRNNDAFVEEQGEDFDAEGSDKFIASIDADGLKAINDNLGHKKGDALLRAIGYAINAELSGDAKGYHLHGDEFTITGNNRDEIEQITQRAAERLKEATITGMTPDGEEIELKGIGFSYGISDTLQEAENELARNKAEREKTGERSPRGELPARVLRKGRPEATNTGQSTKEKSERLTSNRPQFVMEEPTGPSAEDITKEAHRAATSPRSRVRKPTEAQLKAGNYKKGHVTLQQLPLTIENAAGTKRKPDWPNLQNHYGYIKGTLGKDGDQIDAFIGPNPQSTKAFVIDQKTKDGKFDEHKVMLGFNSLKQAKQGYLKSYEEGEGRIKAITPTSVKKVKQWIDAGDTRKEFAKGKKEFMFSTEYIREMNEAEARRNALNVASGDENTAMDVYDNQIDEHNFSSDWDVDDAEYALDTEQLNQAIDDTLGREELKKEYMEKEDVTEEEADKLSNYGLMDALGYTLEDDGDFDLSDIATYNEELGYHYTTQDGYVVLRDDNGDFNVVDWKDGQPAYVTVPEDEVAQWMDTESAKGQYEALFRERYGNDWTIDEYSGDAAYWSNTINGITVNVIESPRGAFGEAFIDPEGDPETTEDESVDSVINELHDMTENAEISGVLKMFPVYDGENAVYVDVEYTKEVNGDDITIDNISNGESGAGYDIGSFGEDEISAVKREIETHFANDNTVFDYEPPDAQSKKAPEYKQINKLVNEVLPAAKRIHDMFAGRVSDGGLTLTDNPELEMQVAAHASGLANPIIAKNAIDAMGSNIIEDQPYMYNIPAFFEPTAKGYGAYSAMTGELLADVPVADENEMVALTSMLRDKYLLSQGESIGSMPKKSSIESESNAEINDRYEARLQEMRDAALGLNEHVESVIESWANALGIQKNKRKEFIEKKKSDYTAKYHRKLAASAEEIRKAISELEYAVHDIEVATGENLTLDIDSPYSPIHALIRDEATNYSWKEEMANNKKLRPEMLTRFNAATQKLRGALSVFPFTDKENEEMTKSLIGYAMRNLHLGEPRQDTADYLRSIAEKYDIASLVPALNIEGVTPEFGVKQSIFAEAIPSENYEPAILDLKPEAQYNFTRDAMSLIYDGGGRNVLMDKLGITGYKTIFSEGAYAGGVHPNIVTEMPLLTNLDRDSANLYATALQYLYRQDSVVVQRLVPDSADHDGLARGFRIRFGSAIDEATEARLLEALAAEVSDGAGFTRIDNDAIVLTNIALYSGLSEDEFESKMVDFLTKNEDSFGITEAGTYWADLNLADEEAHHDWSKDREGTALADKIAASGRSDILPWLDSRRKAYQSIIEAYKNGSAEKGISFALSQELSWTWPESPEEGSKFVVSKGRERITGSFVSIQDTKGRPRLAVKIGMQIGDNTLTIDSMVRGIINNAIESDVKSLAFSQQSLKRSSDLTGTLQTLSAQGLISDAYMTSPPDSDVMLYASDILSRPKSSLQDVWINDEIAQAVQATHETQDAFKAPFHTEKPRTKPTQKYADKVEWLMQYKTHRTADESTGEPIWYDTFPPSEFQKTVLAAAMQDLEKAGMPSFNDSKITNIGVSYINNLNIGGFYATDENSLYLNSVIVDSLALNESPATRRVVEQYLAHEMSHYYDYRGEDTSLSMESPLFDINYNNIFPTGETTARLEGAGDIITEVYEFFRDLADSAGARDYLSYPMVYLGKLHGYGRILDAIDTIVDDTTYFSVRLHAMQVAAQIKKETFAQLSAMYFTHPELVQRYLPRSYIFMQEVSHGINQFAAGDGEGHLRAVFRARDTNSVRDIRRRRLANEGVGSGIAEEGAGKKVRVVPAKEKRNRGESETSDAIRRVTRENKGEFSKRDVTKSFAKAAEEEIKFAVANNGEMLLHTEREEMFDRSDLLVQIAEIAKKVEGDNDIMLEVIRVDLGEDTPLSPHERDAIRAFLSEYRAGMSTYSGTTSIFGDKSFTDDKQAFMFESMEHALKNRMSKASGVNEDEIWKMSRDDYVGDTTGEELKLREDRHYHLVSKKNNEYIKLRIDQAAHKAKVLNILDAYANKTGHLIPYDLFDRLYTNETLYNSAPKWMKEVVDEAREEHSLMINSSNDAGAIENFFTRAEHYRTYRNLKDEANRKIVRGVTPYSGFRTIKQIEDIVDESFDSFLVPSIIPKIKLPRFSMNNDEGGIPNNGDATQVPDEHIARRAIDGYRAAAQSVVDWIDNGLNPLSGLPQLDNFLRGRRQAVGRIAKVNELTRRIYNIFEQATEEEAKSIYEYLTNAEGALADPGRLPNRNVLVHRERGTGRFFRKKEEVDLRQETIAVKRLINHVGRSLVEHGVIPAMSFKHFENKYLPRLYLAHLLGEGGYRKIVGGKKLSTLDYSKKRNLGLDDVTRMVLGEIKDPAYVAAKTVGVPMRDIAILDFLQKISENGEWSVPGVIVNYGGKKVTAYWLIEEGESMLERAQYMKGDDATYTRSIATDMIGTGRQKLSEAFGEDFEPKLWRQVPNTPRYGALRGLWVRKEIYNDMLSTMGGNPAESTMERLLGQGGIATKVTQWWKMMKVPLNPPSQVRNFVSNGVLMNLSGVPMRRIPGLIKHALHDIRTNGKYWRIAKSEGVTESTFTANELIRIDNELLNLKKRMGVSRDAMDYLQHVGSIISNFASDSYQFSEGLFKTAMIIDAMENQGKGAGEAAELASKWLFDYSLVGPNIKYLRNAPIGVPFITFYAKALPRMVEALLLHPHRFAPYIAVPWLMAEAIAKHMDVGGDDLDKLKKALPVWLQERGHTMIMPYKDAAGRWQIFDYGYFMPWGMYWDVLKDIGEGQPGEVIKTLGLFGGPVPELITAIKGGTDSFTGRPIYRPEDPPKRQFEDILLYLTRMALPTWITDRGAVAHMYRALTGHVDPRTGEPTTTATQASLRFVGMNVYPVDPQYTRARNLMFMQIEIKDIITRMRSKLRDRNLNDKQRADIRAEYQEYLKRKIDKMREYAKESEVHENLRVK